MGRHNDFARNQALAGVQQASLAKFRAITISGASQDNSKFAPHW